MNFETNKKPYYFSKTGKLLNNTSTHKIMWALIKKQLEMSKSKYDI